MGKKCKALNLDRGGTWRAILSNWGVNCYNRKFEKEIEKLVKDYGEKV
jgi:hypothetical protein